MMQNPPLEEINKLRDLLNNREYLTVSEKAKSLIEQYPNNFIIWNMHGVTAYERGKLEDAINSYKKAIYFNPNYAYAYNNLGLALKDQGKLDKAILAIKKAKSLKPDYVDAYNNLGVILSEQCKFEEAIKIFKKAISLQPDYAEAYNNLGAVLKDLGKLNEAILMIRKAMSLKPNYVDAFNNLGAVQRDQGKLNEAIESFKKAISLQPDYVDAYNNLGAVLSELGRLDESVKACEKAIFLKPNYELARASKLYQQAQMCSWEDIKNESKWIAQLGIGKQAIRPFYVLSLEDDPDRQQKRAINYYKSKFLQKPILRNFHKIKHKTIRVGYFSSDFKEHPVSYLLAGIIEKHNRDQFKIYGYSIIKTNKDSISQRLINAFDEFRDVSQINDKDVALLARKDEIDIAIDLNGYTKNSRTGIFSYRAAPIQINYLGYPGTLGASCIDYILADPLVIPPKSRNYYSEKIIYMPHSYQPNDNTRIISQKKITRLDMGLPENNFVFCCFNNSYKITSEEFDIWMRIMKNAKDSVLWLFKSNKWAENNLKKEAEKRDVSPSRIIFAENLPQEEHLGRHKLADLFIDTFNYNAHTTTSDALWAGLPVVTKMGNSFAARVAGSLLHAIECPELVTYTKEKYEALIIELANNPIKLLKIREKLANNRLSKPLFNTELYTVNFEKVLKQVFENYNKYNKTK